MKLTKLSLVAILAMSAAYAGGDIIPQEPAVEATTCNSDTTIDSKAVAYYYTTDDVDFFDKANSELGTAVTFDIAHKLTNNVTANFSAVGYTNWLDEDAGYMEGSETGTFLNVANLTATFGDTTLVGGRQLLDTPMLGGFDWLLAPGAFEAYTLVNNSISNLTLVGSYVVKYRGNNSGSSFAELNGDNYAFGAAYSDTFDASVWYYNLDSLYTQVYADAGVELAGMTLNAQFATTDHETGDDSTAYGVKLATEVSGFNLSAAVSNVTDNSVGFIGRDSLYTSSWNTFGAGAFEAGEDTLSWKVGASTELSGLATEVSYAAYGDEGSELDVILGYGVSDCISLDLIYSLTDYDVVTDSSDAQGALEVIATYKF